MKQHAPVLILIIVALVAIFVMIASIQSPIKSDITGAATYGSSNVFTISASDTKATINIDNNDGTTANLPLIVATSIINLGTGSNSDDLFYLESETCTGSSSVSDCSGAKFLVISSNYAHVFRITSIDTSKNEIDLSDMTRGTESNNNLYNDGSATSIAVGDITIILTITESSNTITFTSTGSSNNAEIELDDKATLTIINTNTASQQFEGFKFSEYNDGNLAPDKYISDMSIAVTFNSNLNSMTITQPSLSTADGSGWYKASTNDPLTKTFYSNKGTLFTYDDDEKHYLTVGHFAGTATASVITAKTQQEATGWTMYGVDTDGDVGKDSSLVLDSSGNAHISYFDETNDALKYAYETETGWYIQTIDKDNTGRSSDIALDSKDYPHIIYTDSTNKKLKYAFFDGTAWQIFNLDNDYAISPGIIINSKNYPNIVYYDFAEDDLVYTEYDGVEWITEHIDYEGDVGTDASIAVDSKDYPHISYFDNNYGILKYAWFDGANWVTKEIDSSGTTGWYSSITLDNDNYPRIWYYNTLQDKVMSMQYLGNDLWDEQTFSLEGLDIYKGDIILDSDDYIHFSYYWQEDADLRYAVGILE